jgi:hypothetical protein
MTMKYSAFWDVKPFQRNLQAFREILLVFTFRVEEFFRNVG